MMDVNLRNDYTSPKMFFFPLPFSYNLLQNDIDRIITELDFEYGWFSELNEARQDAMIDISFNLGQTRLRKFKKALTAMEKSDWDTAANEFMDSKWSKQVGNRAKELTEIIRNGKY